MSLYESISTESLHVKGTDNKAVRTKYKHVPGIQIELLHSLKHTKYIIKHSAIKSNPSHLFLYFQIPDKSAGGTLEALKIGE